MKRIFTVHLLDIAEFREAAPTPPKGVIPITYTRHSRPSMRGKESGIMTMGSIYPPVQERGG